MADEGCSGRRCHAAKFSTRLEPGDLAQACREAAALEWTAEGREALETVLRELVKEGVQPGDRRQVKTLGVVRAFAYLNGAEAVLPEHLEVAAHCLWDDPVEQPAVVARVIATDRQPARYARQSTSVGGGGDSRRRRSPRPGEGRHGGGQAGGDRSTPRRARVPIRGPPRMRAYVREQIRKLRLASIAAV